MKKKIYSFLFVLILFICCISFTGKNYGKIKSAIGSFLNLNENSRSQTNITGLIKTGNTGRIDEEQLCLMNTPTNIKCRMLSGMMVEFQFRITDIHAARELEEQFKTRAIKRTDLLVWYDYSVMDEDYTLKKDFYYLYATVNVKKISDFGEFCVNSLKYVVNDNETMSYIHSDFHNNFYNGCQFDSCEFAYLETDDKHMFSYGSTEGFIKGDDVTYNVCYMITEEMLSKDNIYFAYHFAMRQDAALLDKNQKYIKISLGESYDQNFKE